MAKRKKSFLSEMRGQSDPIKKKEIAPQQQSKQTKPKILIEVDEIEDEDEDWEEDIEGFVDEQELDAEERGRIAVVASEQNCKVEVVERLLKGLKAFSGDFDCVLVELAKEVSGKELSITEIDELTMKKSVQLMGEANNPENWSIESRRLYDPNF